MAHRGFPGILPEVGAFPPRGAGPVPEEEAQVGEAKLGPDLRGHGEGEGVEEEAFQGVAGALPEEVLEGGALPQGEEGEVGEVGPGPGGKAQGGGPEAQEGQGPGRGQGV